MARRNHLDFRDWQAGGGELARVTDGIAAVAGVAATSGATNAAYGPGVFTELAVLAAVFNGTMTAFARESAAVKDRASGVPTDEWARLALRRAARGDPELALTAEATRQLRELDASRALPSMAEIAIDKTGKPRHDGKPGGELVRGRAKDGTHYREAYITAQCVARGAGITVAAARVVPRQTMGELVSIIGSRVLDACSDAGIDPMLLLDREFFSGDAIAWLAASGAAWAMPCRNTVRVKAALCEFAAGKRGRVSIAYVSNGHGGEVPYTMVIERRTRPGPGRLPEDVYVAFAVSGPGVRIRKRYKKRWGIETGYRMPRRSMISTSSRSEDVRTLCFMLSLAVHNAWVMACEAARLASRGGWLAQAEFRLAMAIAILASVLESRPEPEPPPPILP